MPNRPIAATRIIPNASTGDRGLMIPQATVPITHALVVLVDYIGKSKAGSHHTRNQPSKPNSHRLGSANSTSHPSVMSMNNGRLMRNNITPIWFNGWLGLLDSLSIPLMNTKFLLSCDTDDLLTLKGAKPATWGNIEDEFATISKLSMDAGGTVLFVYGGRHFGATLSPIIPSLGMSDATSFEIDDLRELLNRHLPDRGALLIMDSFGLERGAAFADFSLRPSDQVCVPTEEQSEQSWTLRLITGTSSHAKPEFNPTTIRSHRLADNLGDRQISADHYLFLLSRESSNSDSVTTDYPHRSPSLQKSIAPVRDASLYLIAKTANANNLTNPTSSESELIGFMLVQQDGAGFTEETWTCRTQEKLPDIFYAHRVSHTGDAENPTWPLIEYLSGIPGIIEDTTERIDDANHTFRTIRLDKLRLHLDDCSVQKFVWSGFRKTKKSPPRAAFWYKVTDGPRAVYCAGTEERPDFGRESWWSASEAPLKGPKLTFSRLAKDAILPALTFTSIELP
jgi:hypothetical protein